MLEEKNMCYRKSYSALKTNFKEGCDCQFACIFYAACSFNLYVLTEQSKDDIM